MSVPLHSALRCRTHPSMLTITVQNFTKICASFHGTCATKKPSNRFGDSLEIRDKTFKTDSLTNVTPALISKVSKNIHQRPNHPLNLIFKRIENFLHSSYLKRGNPIFSVYNNISPIVTHKQNFDSLLVPTNHVSRSASDTYYINSEYMLRSHTSAHEVDLIRSGLDAYAVAGDCYRRDEIDSTHYPVFHQMEMARLYSDYELFSQVEDRTSLSLLEDGVRCEAKQERHTMETVKFLEFELKSHLEALMKCLFGQDLQLRWVDAYFPFTHPSWEMEIFHKGEWVEMLGCGVLEQKIVDNGGATSKAGWAAGMGLERLAMKLYEIPDIRLFWSEDSGFLHQFEGKHFNDPITYKEVSKYPQCINDISFWISEGFTPNDFYDLVRSTAGDLIEQVSLIDEFQHPKNGRVSHCYRLVYRHMERTLTQQEVNVIHKEVETRAADDLSVEIR